MSRERSGPTVRAARLSGVVLSGTIAGAVLLGAQVPRPLVLVGGTIVDVSDFGRSTGDTADAVVVVHDRKIVAAGPRSRVSVPADGRELDVSGAFIVPGLNDVFATVNNQSQANAYLYMGVTSIVGLDEPGGRRGALFTAARPGPRIYPLDSIIGYDESALPPHQRSVYDLATKGRVLSTDELNAEVESQAKRGIKVLLLYYTLSPAQVRTVVARARQLGLATIGELGATTYAEAAASGVMAFVHTSRYSLDVADSALRAEVAKAPFGPPRRAFYEFLTALAPDDPRLLRQAAVYGKRRVGLIPTLAMNYLEQPGHANPWKEPVAALLDPADIHLPANRETGLQAQPANAVRDGFPPGTSQQLAVIESVYCKAGATYLAGSGTDAFGTMAGLSLHIELEMLVKACLTPRQALAAATANVGTLFAWRATGQVRAGYDADVVVVDADPTRDISNLKKIRYVIRDGELLGRAALLNRGSR